MKEIIKKNPNKTINEYNSYKVNPGDTLYSIARKFNTTIANLMAINSNLSSILQVGELIKIPEIN